PAQHSAALAFVGVQNFLPSAAEEFDVGSQFALDLRDQRHALRKPLPRAFDFKPHHLAERGSVFAVTYCRFTHAKTAQVFEGKINSSFSKVRAHVLPEVRELQRGAGVIGKLLALESRYPHR